MRRKEKQQASHARPRRIPPAGRLAVFLTALAAGLLLGGGALFSEELEATFYHVYSPKIAAGETVRTVVLSDLHNREFGPENAELVEQIQVLEPDIIAIAGDMVNADEGSLAVVLGLCEKLVGIAPVYYSPGNHESNLMYEQGVLIESQLSQLGVHVLVNRAEEAVIHKTSFLIGGLTTAPEGYEEYGAAFFAEYEKNYLPHYSNESSSFRAQESGESFASLSQKIQNFVDIELERYEAFVLENGLSKDKATYQSRMQYANRLLETEKRKEMAAHDVRIEAIDLYNAFMTRFVLIPTYDENKEFYMSRTKVGVDYFADEAKEHLASATELGEEIEHNAYASAQIGGKGVTPNASAQADQRIEELKEELARLSAQSRELCSTYVKEKRDGYIQVCFTAPDMVNMAAGAVLLTGPAFGFIAAYGSTGAPLPDSPGVFCGCMGAGPGGNQRGAAGRHNGHSTAAVSACGRRNPISVRFQGGMVLPGRNVRRQFGRHSPGGLRRGPGGVSRRVLYHAGYIHFRNRALNGTAGNP